MASKVFINLPVKDLDKSVAFFSGLGSVSTQSLQMRMQPA